MKLPLEPIPAVLHDDFVMRSSRRAFCSGQATTRGTRRGIGSADALDCRAELGGQAVRVADPIQAEVIVRTNVEEPSKDIGRHGRSACKIDGGTAN